MRFDTLDLRAIGPFRGVKIDLSAGDRGLHLVFGPNEAGKSSALRAVRDLLFDFDRQTRAAFDRKSSELFVGATLADESGSRLAFLRGKRDKQKLFEPDGRTPLDNTALARFLGNISATAYDSLFALDHARLREGGGEILKGKGDLGPLVFASGVDLASLSTLRKDLEARHAELFKPDGKLPAINRRLAELNASLRQVEEWKLPWPSYEAKHREAARRSAEARSLTDERRDARKAAERLKRLTAARPDLDRRRACLAERRGLDHVRPLSDDFAGRRVAAERAIAAAEALGGDAARRLAEVDRLRTEIIPPGPIVDKAAQIDRLYRASQGHQGDLAAIGPLRAAAEALNLDVVAARDRLGLPAGVDPRPSTTLLSTLKRLAGSLPQLQADCKQSAATIDRLDAQGDEFDGGEVDLSDLDAAINRGRKVEGESSRLDLERSDRKVLIRKADALRRGLIPAPPTGRDLAELTCPGPETIQRHQATLNDAEGAVDLLDQKLDQARGELRRVAADLDAQARECVVPTLAELVATRAHRDATWSRLKAVLDEGRVDDLGVLPTDVQAAIAEADERADALRAEADRVNRRARWEADRAQLIERKDELSAERDAALDDLETVRSAWSSSWSSTGVEPLSPREMLAWVQKREEYAEIVGQRVAALDDEILGAEARATAAARAIASALDALRIEPGSGETDLIMRLDEASRAHKRLADRESRRAQLTLARDAAKAEDEEARRVLKEWREGWSRAIRPLGLGPAGEAVEARELLDWLHSHQSARAADAEVAEVGPRIEAFEADVSGLCAGVADDLIDAPAASIVAALAERLKVAEASAARLAGLDERATQAAVDAASAAAGARLQADRLAALCLEAGRAGPADLPEAERLAAELRRLDAAISEAEERLMGHVHGGSIASLEAEAAVIDLDTVGDEVRALEARAADLEERAGAATRELGGLDAELRTMAESSGRGAAVDALDRAEEIRGAMERDILKYVEAKLAAEVLERAVKAYLAANRGPIIDDAGRLFARLTGGRFSGIDVDYGADRQALIGLRAPGGAHVEVDAMSQGTADQLYLALKLAGIGHHLDQQPPMPVLLDDILIHFDDERSAAALTILGELSARTQVLLFTHHEHLVELASRTLPRETLFVHRLGNDRPAAV